MSIRNLGAATAVLMVLAGCGSESDPGAGAVEAATGGSQSTSAPVAPAASATAANAPPVISGTPLARVQANADYLFQPGASDPDSDPLRFSAGNLPPWASLDRATGRLYGRPQASDKGVYGPITLTVTDGLYVVALPAFEVSVEPAPGAGSIKLSWRVPERNADGSVIDVPPRFRIHYGRSSRGYDVAVTLPDPGVSRYELANLDSGTWYLAMTSISAEGLESDLSPEMVARVN